MNLRTPSQKNKESEKEVVRAEGRGAGYHQTTMKTQKLTRFELSARILTLYTAAAITVASFLFVYPDYDPLLLGVNPQLAQTLTYGGIAVFLAAYSWWWPRFGGLIAVLYGSYKLLGYPGNLLAGHDPFTRNLFTDMPAPAYYTLYSLFVIGGILCILSGLRAKPQLSHETRTSQWLRKAAFGLTLGSASVAFIYVLMSFLLIRNGISDYFSGSLVSGLIVAVPVLVILAFISRKWEAQGGLLGLIVGVTSLIVTLGSGLEMPLKMMSLVTWSMLLTGAILNVACGFIIIRD